MMRREALAVAALATATFLAYAWSGHFWIDKIDEGYFLDMADRVSRGELPYRDFSTYYTPGIFYLFAATFKLFGPSLLWPRYLMAVLRAATLLLTYGLARRVAPWPIAVLPFAATALLDAWPILPEPHPSWPAIVLCLATLECVTRHSCSGRLRWLVLAGLSASVCFLFKQNIGAFTAIALGGYVVLRPRMPSGRALKAIQTGFALVAAAAVTVLIWPEVDGLVLGALWLPVLAAFGLALRPALCAPTGDLADGLCSTLVESAATIVPFVLVTLAWLVPLAIALGPRNVPVGLFLGSINEASIETRLAGFTGGVRPLAIVAIWIPALLVRSKQTLIAALALTVIVPFLPLWEGPRDPLTFDPQLAGPLGWLDNAVGTVHLYLPSLAAWAAIVTLAATRATDTGLWYLLFGTLAALTIYPRSDTLHVLVGGPPLFVAGAYVLGRVWRSVRRPSVMLSLMIVPLVGIAPPLAWRATAIVSPEDDIARMAYASLDMPRAPVTVPSNMASDFGNVVRYVEAGTPPGAPFFAYPTEPIFNFLTGRPNPTHFDHFLPGTLSDQDMRDVIDDLQRAQPRYVLWSHYDVQAFETDPGNRILSDYIWNCYDEVAAFNLYLVLERRPDQC